MMFEILETTNETEFNVQVAPGVFCSKKYSLVFRTIVVVNS